GRAASACASSGVAAATSPVQAIDAGHRSPRRDHGAPVAVVRARPGVRAHLRRSWSTLAEKRDEIGAWLWKSLREISTLPALSASWQKVPANLLRRQAPWLGGREGWRFPPYTLSLMLPQIWTRESRF